MQPETIAQDLFLIYKGSHNHDQVRSDGILARYFQVTSSVILYLGKESVVIDSGARFYQNEIKRRISTFIDPLDVKYFIATHYHHDHLDNSVLFPNANRILDYGMVTPDGIMTVYDDPSLIPAPDDIQIFATPGHVKNHISVLIEIDGVRYVCAGDAVRQEIIDGRIRPEYVSDEYVESVRKVYDRADVIIPGHGDLIRVDKANLPKLLLES